MDTPSDNSENIVTPVGSSNCNGLTSVAIPEVSTSTEEKTQTQGCPQGMSESKASDEKKPSKDEKKPSKKVGWYVLRAAYGSESQTYDYLIQHSLNIDEVFWPTHDVTHTKHGRVVHVQESLMPNILFAHSSREELEKFVYDNYHLPNLRFYYHQYHKDDVLIREPLVVPDRQMKSFRKIYESAEDDIYIACDVIKKFTKGQMVRVIGGPFEGVVGHVSRFKGQQRVGVIIDGLCTAVSAYIKNKYLEPISEER